MTNKYGFIYSEPKAEDWVFGATGNLSTDILQPDGQWDAYLPEEELQNRGFEVYACATFGTLNCLETILRRRFGFKDNYSDRYVAKMTDTDKKQGNDPQIIAEFIRHNGDVDEKDYPYAGNSFEEYYAPTSIQLSVKAKKFVTNYDFKHDIVPSDPKSMKEALKYSPLGISVRGWVLDDATGYYKAGEGQDNHWCMCYGYEDEKYWKVFDTYDNTLKKVEWAHRPMLVKRYHVDLSPATVSWLDDLKKAMQAFLEWVTGQKRALEQPVVPQEPPKPSTPPPTPPGPSEPPRVEIWASAIEQQEGGQPGDLNMRLNNPGNLKYTTYTATLGAKQSTELIIGAAQRGPAGSDGGYFCRFDTLEEGRSALRHFLIDAASNRLKSYKNNTLDQFTETYARPPNKKYVNAVAKALQVDPSIPISKLIS
jgi:hypothetical protein